MTKIKICGLQRLEDIDAVNEALPDYAGFVFAESRRRVGVEEAAALKARLSPKISAVGVFVNADQEDIVRLVGDGTIDLVQLHGDENACYIETLRKRVSCPIIKAVRVQSAAHVLAAEKLPCDLLLLDTYQPGAYGGTGQTFNYAMIPPLRKPFFLAGGLTPDNVDAALAIAPYAVDVSGGVETNGVKDKAKIDAMVQIVRNFTRL